MDPARNQVRYEFVLMIILSDLKLFDLSASKVKIMLILSMIMGELYSKKDFQNYSYAMNCSWKCSGFDSA